MVPYPYRLQCRPLNPPFQSPAGDDVGHPGTLRAPVEVLDAHVPPGSLRAQAGERKDDLVLPRCQTAQAECRMQATVEGDGVGREGPLMGFAVLDGP